MEKTASNRICVCIDETDYSKCSELLSTYQFSELRQDLCRFSLDEVERLTSVHKNLIFTCRFTDYSPDKALRHILTAVRNGVWGVDVDCSAPSAFLDKVKEAAKDNGVVLILSSHPAKVPSPEELKDLYLKCRKAGADIVKIVPAAKDIDEASSVLSLYHSLDTEKDRNSLVAFAMGEAGRYTRLSCLGLGAPFTYCYSRAPLAEGQFSHEEMSRLLGTDTVFPPFRIGDMSESSLFSRFCENLPAQKRNRKDKSVCIPCSKSIVQRALLAAAISNGQTVLRNYEPCEDTKAAIAFIRKCGCLVKVSRDGSSGRGEKMIIIRSAGIQKWKNFKFAQVGESALLARLVLPLAAFASSLRNQTETAVKTVVTGEGSLMKRDFTSTVKALKAAGVKCSATKTSEGFRLPITVAGAAFWKKIVISGKDSSQLVSGLLMVLPLLSHDTLMVVEDAVSIPFIELTLKVINDFGIRIGVKKEGRRFTFSINGKQNYVPVDMFLESDWSSAANFAVAGAVVSVISRKLSQKESLVIKKMNLRSSQADEAILDVLEQCGAHIKTENPDMVEFAKVADHSLFVRRRSFNNLKNISVYADSLDSFTFDATDCPDLFPVLAALAVHCNGESRIKGVGRLDKKESNRALSLLQEFSNMGYCISTQKDEMVIRGFGGKVPCSSGRHSKIFCNSHNDHRIAMAVIICALMRNHLGNPPAEIFLDNVSCIDKSFPTFVERLKMSTS